MDGIFRAETLFLSLTPLVPTPSIPRGRRLMPRRIRIEYIRAIDHVMDGGNAHQDIVLDHRDQ